MLSPATFSDRRRALAATAAALVLGLGCATTAQATVTSRTADLNTGNFTQFDQTNVATGTLSIIRRDTYEGAGAAHATYSGGGTNGYARGIFNVGWADGDDVYYGAALYLPEGFHRALQSQTDLMRHDNFGTYTTTDYGGVGVMNYDKKAHLFREGSYVAGRSGSGVADDGLVTPFTLPEGHWFWLEVHQKLSGTDGIAVNEVWIDGISVASSTRANSYGHGVTRLRYGLVAIGETVQTNPLELWFDRALIRTGYIGPLL